MIRFLTPIIIAAIGALSFGLHSVKIDAKESREELKQVRAAIEAEREAIQILSAEWSYLNQPGKLQAMSEKFLDLQTISVEQVATLKDVALLSPPLSVDAGDDRLIVSVDREETPESTETGLVVQASLDTRGRQGDEH